MPTNYSGAHDAIRTAFKTAWDANAQTVAGSVLAPSVVYDWLDSGETRPAVGQGTPWARVSVAHSDSQQTSFGKDGTRTWKRLGVCMVQIFAPCESGDGPGIAIALAQMVVENLEGAVTGTTDVIFRRAMVKECGQEGTWYQVNVTLFFEWYQVR